MESVDDIEIPTNVGWYTKFFKPKPDTENRHTFLYAIQNIVEKETI